MTIMFMVFLFCLSLVVSEDDHDVGYEDETRAMIYLMRYGYVDPGQWSRSLVTRREYESYVSQAVLEFQAFAGLDQTGALDNVTTQLMRTPRCGVRDVVGPAARVRRRKRYALQGSKWRKQRLSYQVMRYPSSSSLTKRDVDRTVEKAFDMWETASGLEFVNAGENSIDADIEISFASYEHGDGDPFDGPGGTLAHAYFPEFGGDVHMDDTEQWTLESERGTNLLQTLTHEIGHSLGLSHSDIRDSVMAPFYQGYDANLQLKPDDVKAIQALYGPDVSKPTPGPRPSPDHDLCQDSSVDAIFTTADNTTYTFRGDQFWKLTTVSVADGYPRSIRSGWGGVLPDNIDAAFTWSRKGSTYIFKDNLYWKFINQDPAPGYPKTISEGFPGIPDNIDAAFVWGGNGKIYFMKGQKYWKFDPYRTPHVIKRKYPKSVSDWGIPANIDAALRWMNGRTYFFKAGQYWRFDDQRFAISEGSPGYPYPRSTSQWWFGC